MKNNFFTGLLTAWLLAAAHVDVQAVPIVLNPGFENFTASAFPWSGGVEYTAPLENLTVVDNWAITATVFPDVVALVTETGLGINGIQGVVAAAIEGTGGFEQMVNGFDNSNYTVTLLAAGRPPGLGPQPLNITLGGITLNWTGAGGATLIPTTDLLTAYTSDPVALTAGAHVLRIEGTVGFGGSDLSSGFDDVSINEVVPEPSSIALLGLIGMASVAIRRRRE